MKLLCMFCLLFSLIACDSIERQNQTKVNPVSRLKLIDAKVINGYLYQIIEADGHDYISTAPGGICHSENCKCKIKP